MGHVAVVKYLVEAGVDLNPGNFAVGTPLTLARRALARGLGHKKVVAYLERAGATA